VGATGYKSTFRNIDGEINDAVVDLAASQPGQIARFSSRGPTFEGLTKPDVSAPGVSINAAFNSFVQMTDKVRMELTDKVVYNGKTFYYTAQSGTSMATPIVAGTIALWLQAKPDLTPEDIVDVLAHTCTHPDASLDYPNTIYGHGQIDAYAGLLYILDLPDKIPRLSTHQPAAARFHLNGRRLEVEWDGDAPSTTTISVFSIDGKKVLSGKGASFDLSGLPTGIYAVQLGSNQEKTTGSTLIRLD
jgi:subtilisin family serine protease